MYIKGLPLLPSARTVQKKSPRTGPKTSQLQRSQARRIVGATKLARGAAPPVVVAAPGKQSQEFLGF